MRPHSGFKGSTSPHVQRLWIRRSPLTASAYKDIVKSSHLFLDPLHDKKNIGPKLGATKASSITVYKRALLALLNAMADALIEFYSPTQINHFAW